MTKPRKYIRSASAKRAKELRQYAHDRLDFLARPENKLCAVAKALKMDFEEIRATEIHHKNGRCGRLLLDQRFWIPVSSFGHNWLHAHIAEARKLGLICEQGKWNHWEP